MKVRFSVHTVTASGMRVRCSVHTVTASGVRVRCSVHTGTASGVRVRCSVHTGTTSGAQLPQGSNDARAYGRLCCGTVRYLLVTSGGRNRFPLYFDSDLRKYVSF